MTSVIASDVTVSSDLLFIVVSLSVPLLGAGIGFMVKKLIAVVARLTDAIASLENCVAVAVTRIEHLEKQNERQHQENLARMGKP